MSKILYTALIILGLMMINPAFINEWLKALLSNPFIFLTGFTLGLVIGIAWNNKEAKGLKAERDAVKAEKAGMQRDLDRCEAKYKELKESGMFIYHDPEDAPES
jgi:multisubunit Na+/H+ antiporter MnhG subunit